MHISRKWRLGVCIKLLFRVLMFINSAVFPYLFRRRPQRTVLFRWSKLQSGQFTEHCDSKHPLYFSSIVVLLLRRLLRLSSFEGFGMSDMLFCHPALACKNRLNEGNKLKKNTRHLIMQTAIISCSLWDKLLAITCWIAVSSLQFTLQHLLSKAPLPQNKTEGIVCSGRDLMSIYSVWILTLDKKVTVHDGYIAMNHH